jgi:hypothetical protein
MDPQELMYLCSIADHSASQRILVKSTRPLYNHHFTLSTPELGQSPTDIPQAPRKRYSTFHTHTCINFQLTFFFVVLLKRKVHLNSDLYVEMQLEDLTSKDLLVFN